MRIFASLIASLVGAKLLLDAAPLAFVTAGQELMFRWWFIAVLSLYGAMGVLLIPRTGFAGMSTTRRGTVLALVHGTVVGLCTIAVDAIRPVEEVLKVDSAHHPLPEGILVYWYGAVVSEIWFHLLPVPLFVFVIVHLTRRQERQEVAFWIAAAVLSLWEGRRILTDSELWVPIEIVRSAITYAANLSGIWLFRRFGFMTAVEQRLASYAWWHVLWPLAREWVR